MAIHILYFFIKYATLAAAKLKSPRTSVAQKIFVLIVTKVLISLHMHKSAKTKTKESSSYLGGNGIFRCPFISFCFV